MKLNLKRLGLLAGKAAREFARRAGLTPQRLDLMHLAGTCDLSQREIAERLCVSRPVVSRMLAALERIGLVYRIEDPRDRRNKFTRLTTEGLHAVAQCCPEPTSRGAQATGEAIWLDAWRAKIAGLGLRVDSILRARAPRDFARLAAWNRSYCDRSAPPKAAPKIAPARDPELVALLEAAGVDVEAWCTGHWVPTPSLSYEAIRSRLARTPRTHSCETAQPPGVFKLSFESARSDREVCRSTHRRVPAAGVNAQTWPGGARP